MENYNALAVQPARVPWNKDTLFGAKSPLRPGHVWSISTKLQIDDKKRDLALFNLAIHSKRRGCDFVAVQVGYVARGLTTRQHARLVQEWVASIGLDPAKFGTHSLRRTKVVLIYRRTGNHRAVQLLLGHSKIESTLRSLGIEVDDAIEIAEKQERKRSRVTN